jgi:hypothetical protein
LFFAVPAWVFHGTYHERYGDEVIDVVEFEPTDKQRNTIGVEIFLLFFIPSLTGALRGHFLNVRRTTMEMRTAKHHLGVPGEH